MPSFHCENIDEILEVMMAKARALSCSVWGSLELSALRLIKSEPETVTLASLGIHSKVFQFGL